MQINIQELNKVQFLNLSQAEITSEGKIKLPDGRSFKVDLVKGGKGVKLDADQLQNLAAKALDILKSTGEQFETLNKVSIKKESVTHFVNEEKKMFTGDEQWKKTTAKSFEVFNQSLTKTENPDKAPDKANENSETQPQEVNNKSVHHDIPSIPQATSKIMKRNAVSELLARSETGGPDKLSESLIDLLDKNNPDMKFNEKIENFKSQHPEKIKMLKEKGWIPLKKAIGDQMTKSELDPDNKGVSYEQFRKNLNDFVTELVNEASGTMGIGKITAGGLGTPGYNSDIDLNMKAGEGARLSTGDMVVARAMANLMSTGILGAMPGLAIDTEWYVDRKFLGDSAQSTEAKAQIATLDLAMGVMQAKEGFKNEPEKYDEFKKRQLEPSPNESDEVTKLKQVKKELFKQAESFYNKMEEDVSKELLLQNNIPITTLSKEQISEKVKEMKSAPDFEKKYYNAKVLVQYRSQTALGKQCAILEKQIEEKTQSLKGLEPAQANEVQGQIDKLIVDHDLLYALINCTQAEGTMSSNELKTTLDSKLGQAVARDTEKQVKVLHKSLQPLRNLPTVKVKGKRVRTMIEIGKQRKAGAEYTIPQLLLAGQERLAQFSHKIQEKNDPVDAGKYCLRVAESNSHALELLKKEKGSLPGLEDLIKQAEEFYTQAKHLEQCKRGFNLNGVVIKKMLGEQFQKINPQVNADKMSADLDGLIQMDEKGGAWAGKVMLKREKMKGMAAHLFHKGYLKSTERSLLLQKGTIEKPSGMTDEKFNSLLAIRAILQARAGYKTEKAKYGPLKELHNEGKTLTREHYQLNSGDQIKEFFTKVEKFTLSVQEYMVEKDAMPKLAANLKDFNFTERWTGQGK